MPMSDADATALLDQLVREIEAADAARLERADHHIECADGIVSRIKRALGLCDGRQAVVDVRLSVPLEREGGDGA